MMIPGEWFAQAAERIAPHIRETPLVYDSTHDLYLKMEQDQVTGSFKARGALNKVLSLQPWEQQLGLVAASAGNHGQGVALAGRLVGAPVTIFVSASAVPAKIAKMRQLGAELNLVNGGYAEAEAAGLAWAKEQKKTWVSPYNDGQIIAGQGTLAMEVLRQLLREGFRGQELTWLVPVGGGGLAAGICLVLSQAAQSPISRQRHLVVGVQSEASAFFHALYHQNSQAGVIETPSLADGLAGPVEAGSLTIPILRSCLDDLLLISETELKMALRYAWQHYQVVLEGSAAVGLAAVLAGKIQKRPLLLVFSGGNIQPEVHAEIIKEFM